MVMNDAPPACAKAPCKSCPYRRDVPSGVWAATEYAKLPAYDGSMIDQLEGGRALFMCHQNDGHLCAGWVGCHGPDNLLALRMNRVDDSVWGYVSPVRLFKSGAQAAAHGLRDIARPGTRAIAMIWRLARALQSKE